MAPAVAGSSVKVLVNAGSMVTAGTALTTAIYSASNREQECTVGSKIGKTTLDLTFRGATASGAIEVAVFKLERRDVVPSANASPLPLDANTSSIGLQSSMAQVLPGRTLKFDVVPVNNDTVARRKYIIRWDKYNFGTIRAGDFYCILFFNRGATGAKIDVHCRFNEWV